jgi:hypothetical protein
MDMKPLAQAALVIGALAFAACSGGLGPSVARELERGTWGGENAGVIVADSVAHVHIGCTNGNFRLPFTFDQNGRFEAAGEYLIRAHPVAIGPMLPAKLEGSVSNEELTFTVTVNDTIAKQTVTLGPAKVRLGRDPKMGPCPICSVAPANEVR